MEIAFRIIAACQSVCFIAVGVLGWWMSSPDKLRHGDRRHTVDVLTCAGLWMVGAAELVLLGALI